MSDLLVKAWEPIVAAGFLILKVFLVLLHRTDHILVVFGNDHLCFWGIHTHPTDQIDGPSYWHPPNLISMKKKKDCHQPQVRQALALL